MTLRDWANKNDYVILKIDGGRARVDKVPSQWFGPQWVVIPDNVEFTPEQAAAYD